MFPLNSMAGWPIHMNRYVARAPTGTMYPMHFMALCCYHDDQISSWIVKKYINTKHVSVKLARNKNKMMMGQPPPTTGLLAHPTPRSSPDLGSHHPGLGVCPRITLRPLPPPPPPLPGAHTLPLPINPPLSPAHTSLFHPCLDSHNNDTTKPQTT